MRTQARQRSSALLALVAALAAPPVFATVSCSVSATALAFGTYSELSGSPLTSNSAITVTCTLLSGSAITVTATTSLNTGSSGSFVTRTMLAGAQTLNYNIYTTGSFTVIWGDGSGGTSQYVFSLPLTPSSPTNQGTHNARGRIPVAQSVAPGSYTDTMTVTVNY